MVEKTDPVIEHAFAVQGAVGDGHGFHGWQRIYDATPALANHAVSGDAHFQFSAHGRGVR